jgi:hypothetical protein
MEKLEFCIENFRAHTLNKCRMKATLVKIALKIIVRIRYVVMRLKEGRLLSFF